MPFYPPPNMRRRTPPPYRQGFRTPDQFRRQRQPFLYPNQQLSQFRNGGLPNHLNTLMGHVGTITNGVNMMRQIGSIMSIFR